MKARKVSESENKLPPSQVAEIRISKAAEEQAVELDLSGLGLAELPFSVGSLTQLERLDVSYNELESLPESIGNLNALRDFNLSGNRLTTLTEAITRLIKLRTLQLNYNKFKELPEVVCNLAELDFLDVMRNELTTLPENIGNLSKLDVLFASRNNLVVLPETIRYLKRLRGLFLDENRLSELPEGIGKLNLLHLLDVGSNNLSELPQCLASLTQLGYLDVSNNNLASLPEFLRLFGNLENLYLHGNENLGLPADLIGSISKNGTKTSSPAYPRTILDFYFRVQRPLNEVKLLLVGRGGAGKTSIVRRLRENKFSRAQKETRGIEIKTWDINCGKGENVRVNLWDFAGQVITHSTHQFFLTQRSLYVLVLTGREDSQTADAEYWLRLIKAFATDRQSGECSPVIIALNKWESHKFRVDRNHLKEKYPFVVDFVETDCHKDLGIDRLRDLLRETIMGMDSVRKSFPAAWWGIKERLETMREKYLPYSKFREMCAGLGEDQTESQDHLSQVLHALGVALNYSDDPRLRETTVLSPHWVTDGIYKLLRLAVRDDGSGEMHMSDVERVLPREKPAMRLYLVELMRRFELAFPLADDHDQWLVPQRLSGEQPELDPALDAKESTRIRYRYSVLPEGLLPRFITRTYPLSAGQPRWVNGVVLEEDGARGLIRADIDERVISVVVTGAEDARRRLAGLIRGDLEAIHSDIEGLDPIGEIELSDNPGIFINFRTLEADEQLRQESYAATDHGTITVDHTQELNRVSGFAARDPRTLKAKMFISYSNADSRFLDEFIVRLKPLKSEGLLESWSDRCLTAGVPWDRTIRKELAEADIVVFLQSTRFVASDYIQDIEVEQALKQHEDGRSKVISVILEGCDWQNGVHGKRLGALQALPNKAKPIRDFQPQRHAWEDVMAELRNIIETINRHANFIEGLKKDDPPLRFVDISKFLRRQGK